MTEPTKERPVIPRPERDGKSIADAPRRCFSRLGMVANEPSNGAPSSRVASGPSRE